MRQVFHATATKGWAWCNHNAKQVERTAALRNLLLAGSGWLRFPKGMVGMDSLNKLVEQISFGQDVTFWEQRQLKGWQPHCQPTVAKSLISTIVNCWLVCSSQIAQLRAQSLHCHESWTKQLRDQTLCLSLWDRLFPAAATKGWAWFDHNVMQSWRKVLRFSGSQVSVREWVLRFHKGQGFFKQTCRTNLISAVRCILRTRSERKPVSRYVQLTFKQLFENIVSQCVAMWTSQSINWVDSSNCENSGALSTQNALSMCESFSRHNCLFTRWTPA